MRLTNGLLRILGRLWRGAARRNNDDIDLGPRNRLLALDRHAPYARPVAAEVAAGMVERMARLPVVVIDADRVREAIAGSRSWQLSYWDALIIAAARSAGCDRLLTEDLAEGATYGGVRVENPFTERPRVAERRPDYAEARGPWDDGELFERLERYEDACRDAGMRTNAIHSYWDYARRFLAWRVGEYLPRGTTSTGRPVPAGPATAEDLERQAAAYGTAIEAAGREQATVDTYHRHVMFFIRWLEESSSPAAGFADDTG